MESENKQTPCPAEIEFDNGAGRILKHKCCLWYPHDGARHYTPTLLLTLGGDRVTCDIHGNDVTKTWSPFVDPV